VEGDCYLDAGLDGVLVNERFMRALNLSPDSNGVKRIQRPTILGGKEVRYRSVLPEVSATSYPGLAMSQIEVDFQDIIYDCAIGFPMRDQRIITLDIPTSRLIVQ
jgi:hypothetical protein